MSDSGDFVFVCESSELNAGTPRCFNLADGRRILILKKAGELIAFENKCPHLGYTLDDALIDHDRLTCIWHGWTFSLQTGKRIEGSGRLKYYAIFEENNRVFVSRLTNPRQGE